MAPQTTRMVLEAQLNKRHDSLRQEVNVVTDFSKLGRRSVSKIGPFDMNPPPDHG